MNPFIPPALSAAPHKHPTGPLSAPFARFARHLLLGALVAASAANAAETWTTETGVEVRGRYEDRDNRDLSSPADDDRTDALLRLRLNVDLRNEGSGLSVLFQPQVSVNRYDTPSGDDTTDRTAVHQLYAQWRPPEDPRWTLRLGRQELVYGNQRLIGSFGWDNIGRSFDGARADFRTGRHTVSAFGAQLGDAASRVQTPKFYGVYDTIRLRPTHTVDAYLLHKRDTVQGHKQSVTTVGARSDNALDDGWGYLAEAALQTGRTGGKDLSAWAYSVTVGKTLPVRHRPRLSLEYSAASGGDPSDPDDARTFDQLFPTNHDKYGIIDYQGWRNMRNLRVGATARLPRAATVGIDHHWFWLEDARDAWYGAGGTPNRGAGGAPLHDPTGASGRSVGRELDISANYPVAPDWTLSAGYARFTPGSFIRAVNGRDDPSNWWYLQATYNQ